MRVINLNPHPVTLLSETEIGPDGQPAVICTYPAAAVPCRVASTPGPVEVIDGIPIAGPYTYGEVTGLPDYMDMQVDQDNVYLVSHIVVAALRAKGDPRIGFVLIHDQDKRAMRYEGRVVGSFALHRP